MGCGFVALELWGSRRDGLDAGGDRIGGEAVAAKFDGVCGEKGGALACFGFPLFFALQVGADLRGDFGERALGRGGSVGEPEKVEAFLVTMISLRSPGFLSTKAAARSSGSSSSAPMPSTSQPRSPPRNFVV